MGKIDFTKILPTGILIAILLVVASVVKVGKELPPNDTGQPDTPHVDIKRIQEDIAKDDCRVNGGTWEKGECDIPIEVLVHKKEEKEECLKNGGKWGRLGLSIKEQCNLPTSDAGKTCTDSSQCEGSCLGKDVGVTSGECSDWTIMKGCLAFVENGEAPGRLCAD